MFSFLYNKLYKKIIIFFVILIFGLPYLNKVPYPLFLDIPKYDEIKITDEWKNLTYPCFKVETLSGNWLSDYSRYFNISDFENFRLNPGIYFGKEIKDYKEKKVLIGYGDHMYSLIQPIKDCVKFKIKDSDLYDNNFYFLNIVKPQTCQEHAPNIQSKCQSSYLIEACSNSKTGSMTGLNPCRIGLFGLFDLDEVGLSIVPLKYFQYFENEKDALNYVWFKENKL